MTRGQKWLLIIAFATVVTAWLAIFVLVLAWGLR